MLIILPMAVWAGVEHLPVRSFAIAAPTPD